MAAAKVVKGGLLRGVEIEVTLNSDKFGHGDLGVVQRDANRFLALYATMISIRSWSSSACPSWYAG